MDYFDWDFAEAPTADATTTENRADHGGKPGGSPRIKEVLTDYVYSETYRLGLRPALQRTFWTTISM